MSKQNDQIDAYLDGELPEAEAIALRQWINADHMNARAFAERAVLHQEIRSILNRSRVQNVQNPEQLLHELLEHEAQAEADTVTLVGQVDAPSTKVSARDYAEAGRYLFEHALANKRLLYTAGSAIAAVLLIALSLVFVFSGGQDEPVGDPLADVTLWDTPTPKHLPVVATLTDEVGAQWRSDDKPVPMPMGAQLVAFERYTLTHGFAEITTRRGAKALLQAPCTIELTDHDNAIRLHSGKLVGKCETPTSKGFIVHAPDMDVVDLGTEFGVEADAKQGSTVLVMTGEVRAQPTDRSPLAFTPVVLRKDQARQIVPETGGLGLIAASEAPVFYEDAPHPYVAAVLDAAPVAYWRFEDDANKTIVNEVDPQRDALAMVGPATLTNDGVLGSAGLLENRAEPFGYFETSNPIDQLAGFEQGTIEFWYYADSHHKQADQRENAMLICLHDTSNVLPVPGDINDEMLAIELMDDSWSFHNQRLTPAGWRQHAMRVYPEFFLDGQKRRDLYTDHDHPVQQWQHVVLVKQDGAITLYLDGERVEEMPHTFGPINPVSVRMGQTFAFDVLDPEANPDHVDPKRPLVGRLDEVALYDKPLTAEHIAQHYQLVTGGTGSP